jgi:putative ABC transport system permease protein
MINEAMARAFWPGASPLGQHVDGEEVVGVVDDVRAAADPSEPDTRFQTYRPFAQAPRGTSIWVALHGTVTADVLRRTVAEIDSDLPVNEAGPARALVDRSLVRLGAVGWLLNGFGALGLLLASLGIYGVLAGFVAYRTKEIGLRMAIGAQWRDVLWLVLGQGLRLTGFGALIGLAGAVAGARLLSSIAPELGASAPLAICGMTALLLTVAMLACWVPAHRAARIDPMTALRAE